MLELLDYTRRVKPEIREVKFERGIHVTMNELHVHAFSKGLSRWRYRRVGVDVGRFDLDVHASPE